MAWALRALQAAEDTQQALADVLAAAARWLDSLPQEAQAEWWRAIHFLFLLILHKREPQEREPLSQIIVEETQHHRKDVEEIKMTGAQELLEKGRAEGRIEGERKALRRMLEGRFGPLPESVVKRIQTLTEAQIDAAIQRFLSAKSLEDMAL